MRKSARLLNFLAAAFLKLAAIHNLHGSFRLPAVRAEGLDRFHHIHPLGDLAEDGVLAVEMRRAHRCDEELRAIGVGPRVGHGQEAGLVVLQFEVLIAELRAVDGLTARAIAFSEIARLQHEVGDNTVKAAPFVVKFLARLAHLTSAQCPKVFGTFGRDVLEELKLDLLRGVVAELHAKEHFRVPAGRPIITWRGRLFSLLGGRSNLSLLGLALGRCGRGRTPADLAAVCDLYPLLGFSVLVAMALYFLHEIHPLHNLSEDAVLAVEMRRLDGGHEELRAVRVRARVGHGQEAGAIMLQCEVLVAELRAVD
mmetsp:Transcript_27148/g.45408  ORF Transcript_27148/g.45408 Transcript_27148/m.45408 type:complete len:311 (-) Transcript_27148:329-1261(-)